MNYLAKTLRTDGFKRGLSVVLVGMMISSGLLSQTHHVSADDKANEVVKGILQILIDSQLNKNQRQPPNTPPNQPGQKPQDRGDIKQIRNVLANYAQDATNLTVLYGQEINRKPELRASIGECYQLRAQVTTLARASQQTKQTHLLQTQAQLVDTNWRIFSHKVQLVPNLSREMQKTLERMVQHNQAMCTLLDIEPQLDWRELMRTADALSYEMKAISEELAYAKGQQQHRVLLIARKAHQEASHFAEAVANKKSYRVIVSEYQNFLKLWDALTPHIRVSRSSHLLQHLNRVITLDTSIHNYLWLEKRLDRETLIYLSQGIRTELETLFDRITLTLLISIPDNQGIAASADELNGLCSHLADCVSRGESREEIIDAFSYLPASWVTFSRPFRTIRHPDINEAFRNIEEKLVAIQQTLGYQYELDWNDARQHAALLENMSGHIAEHVQDWSRGPNKPDQAFQYQFYRAMDTLNRSTHDLNLAVLTQKQAEIKAGCEKTAIAWTELHGMLKTCESKEREALAEDSLSITRALLQLEILFLL